MPNFENPSSLVENKSEQIKEIAEQNFALWNEALQSGQAQTVAALYGPEATFLPTMSPNFKQGPGEAAEYFEHFLESQPVGEIVEQTVQNLGEDSYLHSGTYNFMSGPADQRETMAARFSFVWKKDETGQWKIIHHHSSLKPQK